MAETRTLIGSQCVQSKVVVLCPHWSIFKKWNLFVLFKLPSRNYVPLVLFLILIFFDVSGKCIETIKWEFSMMVVVLDIMLSARMGNANDVDWCL